MNYALDRLRLKLVLWLANGIDGNRHSYPYVFEIKKIQGGAKRALEIAGWRVLKSTWSHPG